MNVIECTAVQRINYQRILVYLSTVIHIESCLVYLYWIMYIVYHHTTVRSKLGFQYILGFHSLLPLAFCSLFHHQHSCRDSQFGWSFWGLLFADVWWYFWKATEGAGDLERVRNDSDGRPNVWRLHVQWTHCRDHDAQLLCDWMWVLVPLFHCRIHTSCLLNIQNDIILDTSVYKSNKAIKSNVFVSAASFYLMKK